MSRFLPHAIRRPRALFALATVGALAAALGSPVTASAEQPAAAPQTTVYYSVHDLASNRGTRALYARIISAARTVCPGNDSRDLAIFAASRQCQREAVARAVREVGSPRLAAVAASATMRRG